MSSGYQSKRKRSFYTYALSLLACLALFLGIANAFVFESTKSLDLSPHNHYSVSQGTKKILMGLQKPINVRYYASKNFPPYKSGLRKEITRRLVLLAKALGPEKFHFSLPGDLHLVSDDGKSYQQLAQQGIAPLTLETETGSEIFYSAVVIDYADASLPIIIQAESTRELEYEIAFQALQLQKLRTLPASPEDKLNSLQGDYTLTYIYGQPYLEGKSHDQRSLPLHKQGLLRGVSNIFQKLEGFSSRIQVQFDNDPRSPRRKSIGLTREALQPSAPDFNKDQNEALKLVYYSGIEILSGGARREIISHIRNLHDLQELLIAKLWDMDKPREKVGIFMPKKRTDFSAIEEVLYNGRFQRRAWPEDRLRWFVENLDYEVEEVMIDSKQGISPDIRVLIMVRPERLSERQRYEIEFYLANGGQILLFTGNWHLPLLDQGLRIHKDFRHISELWHGGEPHQELELRALEQGMYPLLEKFGITPEKQGFLVADNNALRYRVYRPGVKSEANPYPQLLSLSGRAGLIPLAQSNPLSPHVLSQGVQSLPLRAGSFLKPDHERLQELDLKVEEVFFAPPEARLVLPSSREKTWLLNYRTPTPQNNKAAFLRQSQEASFQNNFQLQSAEGKTTALLLKGFFPFDPQRLPPPFEEPSKSSETNLPQATSLIQDAYQPRQGALLVVSSPDIFDSLNFHGWDLHAAAQSSAGMGLLEDRHAAVQTSLKQFLSNTLDSFIFGEDLISVRRSFLPPPRKQTGWSSTERGLWTLIVTLGGPFIFLFVLNITKRLKQRRFSKKYN